MSVESHENLFSNDQNLATLRRFSQELARIPPESVTPEGLSYHLAQIIELMASNPDKFDEFTKVNSKWIGRSFFKEIEGYFGLPAAKIEGSLASIFTSAYRFLCELEFTQPGEPSFEVRRTLNFVHDTLDEFSGSDKQQLVFASYLMPAQVAKQLIGHPSVIEFKRFADVVEQSRKLKEQWDKDLDRRQALLDGLASNLGKVASAYNFTGLVHGFQSLKSAKEKEREFSFQSLIGLGIAMTLAPVIQALFVALNLETIDKHRAVLVYSLPIILTFEIIILYFFRVVLSQFRSVKAQLLQIDLRISICQFIESYADYISTIREKDASALIKFESMIFSGLVNNDSGIPATFDGLEQIASLIRSIRSPDKN